MARSCGRDFSEPDLQRIRALLESRPRLSRAVCEARDWRKPASLAQVRPLRLSLLRRSDPRRRIWNEFAERYHYLGYKPPCPEPSCATS